MSYSGKLIESLVRRRTGNIVSRSAALNAKSSIDTKYGSVDERVEYQHLPFSRKWVKDSDLGKSVKKSATLKSPHSLASQPKRASPQKLLPEGRKPKEKRESPQHGVIALQKRQSPLKLPAGKPSTQRISPSKIERRFKQAYKTGAICFTHKGYKIGEWNHGEREVTPIEVKMKTMSFDANTNTYTLSCKMEALDKSFEAKYIEKKIHSEGMQRYFDAIKAHLDKGTKEYKKQQTEKAKLIRNAKENEMWHIISRINDDYRPIKVGAVIGTTPNGRVLKAKTNLIAKGTKGTPISEEEYTYAVAYIKRHKKMNPEYIKPTRESLDRLDARNQ